MRPALRTSQLALFLEFSAFISVIFIPVPSLGTFALIVERLLQTDVQIFLIFFFLYLLAFWSAMYMNYPRAGDGKLSLVPQFNDLPSSLEAMINLGIAGIHFEIDFTSEEFAALEDSHGDHGFKLANLVAFTLFYYYCMLLLVILLLRLLMALLSATFADVRRASELEWRLQFARHVLQLELVVGMWGGATSSGSLQEDGEYSHVFKAYTDVGDDDGDDGGGDDDGSSGGGGGGGGGESPTAAAKADVDSPPNETKSTRDPSPVTLSKRSERLTHVTAKSSHKLIA